MKRLTIVTAAVTALALASAPAFADNNKNKNDGISNKRRTRRKCMRMHNACWSNNTKPSC